MIIINKKERDIVLKDIRGNIVNVKPGESVEVEDSKANKFISLYGFQAVAKKVEVKKIEVKKIEVKKAKRKVNNVSDNDK